jgi:tetratricopeptide (TPR) repeat protein
MAQRDDVVAAHAACGPAWSRSTAQLTRHRGECGVADDLTSLLASGERAAFHGRPGAGVDPLERAAAMATERSLPTESAAAVWLLAVCQAAAGRFGRALEALDGLLPVTTEAPAERRIFGALGEATLASVYRQLGRHDEARAHDGVALRLSDAAGEAGFDALLGLAADAVGLGEASAAADHLASATALVGAHAEWWRQRVRLGWVQAEVALLEGRPADAVSSAAASVDRAEHAGAPRHVAKGLLFQGVSLVEAGRHEEAASILRRAGLLAESLGTLPLLWPARAVLGALVGEDDPLEGQRCLQSARRTVERIAADLPDALRADWFSRPDVAAVLAE